MYSFFKMFSDSKCIRIFKNFIRILTNSQYVDNRDLGMYVDIFNILTTRIQYVDIFKAPLNVHMCPHTICVLSECRVAVSVGCQNLYRCNVCRVSEYSQIKYTQGVGIYIMSPYNICVVRMQRCNMCRVLECRGAIYVGCQIVEVIIYNTCVGMQRCNVCRVSECRGATYVGCRNVEVWERIGPLLPNRLQPGPKLRSQVIIMQLGNYPFKILWERISRTTQTTLPNRLRSGPKLPSQVLSDLTKSYLAQWSKSFDLSVPTHTYE